MPGGHSPAYFALLNQPLPTSPFVWTNDPVSFPGYASFFIAHEIAHQWWGQAVGWKNYHEQWLSEGFAQYFAALVRGARTRARTVHQRAAADAQVGRRPLAAGSRVPRLPAGPSSRRGTDVPGARLQQGRDGAAHAAAADRRRGLLRRAARFLRELALPQGRHGRFPLGDGESRRDASWIASSSAGSSAAAFRRCAFRRPRRATALRVRFEQIGDVFDIPIAVTMNYTTARRRTSSFQSPRRSWSGRFP